MLPESYARLVLPVGREGPAGIRLLGTAFSVGQGKYATAAHLTDQSDNGLILVLPKISQLSAYQDTTDHQIQYKRVAITNYDPASDVAILAVPPDVPNSDWELGNTDTLNVGSHVTSLGYPHCGDGRLALTLQSTYVGARILLPAGPLKRKHIVLNTLSRPGQSGSPIFSSDGNNICAMILGGYVPPGQHVMIGNITPADLNQTTHAISAEYIRALL
jgi:V8-like Glu-specific endopeptidase